MAKAPKPGSTPSSSNAQVTGMIIRHGDKEYPLNLEDLGPEDDLVCRRATGMPISPFFGQDVFGTDSLLMMYWFARRKSGDLNLRYEDLLKTFPTFKSVEDADFEIRGIEETDDDPLESEES